MESRSSCSQTYRRRVDCSVPSASITFITCTQQSFSILVSVLQRGPLAGECPRIERKKKIKPRIAKKKKNRLISAVGYLTTAVLNSTAVRFTRSPHKSKTLARRAWIAVSNARATVGRSRRLRYFFQYLYFVFFFFFLRRKTDTRLMIPSVCECACVCVRVLACDNTSSTAPRRRKRARQPPADCPAAPWTMILLLSV